MLKSFNLYIIGSHRNDEIVLQPCAIKNVPEGVYSTWVSLSMWEQDTIIHIRLS